MSVGSNTELEGESVAVAGSKVSFCTESAAERRGAIGGEFLGGELVLHERINKKRLEGKKRTHCASQKRYDISKPVANSFISPFFLAITLHDTV